VLKKILITYFSSPIIVTKWIIKWFKSIVSKNDENVEDPQVHSISQPEVKPVTEEKSDSNVETSVQEPIVEEIREETQKIKEELTDIFVDEDKKESHNDDLVAAQEITNKLEAGYKKIDEKKDKQKQKEDLDSVQDDLNSMF